MIIAYTTVGHHNQFRECPWYIHVENECESVLQWPKSIWLALFLCLHYNDESIITRLVLIRSVRVHLHSILVKRVIVY